MYKEKMILKKWTLGAGAILGCYSILLAMLKKFWNLIFFKFKVDVWLTVLPTSEVWQYSAELPGDIL